MNKPVWQIAYSIDAVIFDCDSTLSQIEGITALAEQNRVVGAVEQLTERAMGVTGLTASIYKERLDIVQPKETQVAKIAELYHQHLTPDVDAVITLLQALGKQVYVVSAGIFQAVLQFAKTLNIPENNVFAVEVYYDEQGDYADFDHTSPLIGQHGKGLIVNDLRNKHNHIAHIGDGMNDVEAASLVDRFIGYGGACFRQRIADLCPFYVKSKSISPVLPLLLTESEINSLTVDQRIIYQQGLQKIIADKVIIDTEKV